MKILFVENRYKTYFWESLAKIFDDKGHQIFWIVQNHSFAPFIKNVYTIPYPKKIYPLQREEKTIFNFVSSTDRIIRYFNGTSRHYVYYNNEFEQILSNITPDLVIGESTLFHELLIIDICKRNNILYLNPSSTSYPVGRFSFFLHDTKEPYEGSNESLSNEECDILIQNISQRKIIPDYMKKTEISHSQYPKVGSLKDRWTIISSYFKGEVYNTPSPFKKLKQDMTVNTILKQWDTLSSNDNKKLPVNNIVLYPLQMQPEANLDVWGNQFRDQAQLIKELSENLPKDWYLAVKTNPKSKYEMSQDLLQVVKSINNIIPLHSNTNMKEIFEHSDVVVTVTGTIAIECILANKPLGLLGPSIVKEFNGCTVMHRPREIKSIIVSLKNNKIISASTDDKRNLIRRLATSSYQGLITDPVSNPACLEEANLKLVTEAILDIRLQRENNEN